LNITGEAPRLRGATIRITAIVVVPQTVAPVHDILHFKVGGRLDKVATFPRIAFKPIPACAATFASADKATVAPSFTTTFLQLEILFLRMRGILSIIAIHIEGEVVSNNRGSCNGENGKNSEARHGCEGSLAICAERRNDKKLARKTDR